MTGEVFETTLQNLACALAGREITDEFPATQQERIRIAAALGYIDARFVVYMNDTHGLPIEISLDRCLEKFNLWPDWGGLETELVLQKGMSTDAAKRQVAFLKRDFELIHRER